MYSAIYTATTQQAVIGGIDNDVNVESGNVLLKDFDDSYSSLYCMKVATSSKKVFE